MKNYLVSVIIPFYNEENYLKRALNAVIKQSYRNIEIILINDGSTDNSKTIAKIFCEKFEHCKLTNTKNNGPGSARNIGLKIATGTFVTFLDADDELHPKMIEILLKNIIESSSDITICKFKMFNLKGASFVTKGFKNISDKIISKNDACFEMYKHNIVCTVWAKLYKTEIAKKIKFPENLWFEDRPYLFHYFLQSQKISFVDNVLLKIHSNRNSITRRTIERKRIIDQFLIYKKEMAIAEQSKINSIKELIVDYYLSTLVDTYFLLLIDRKKVKEIKTLQNTFLQYVSKFKRHLKDNGLQLKFKKNILLKLIELPRFIPWQLSNFIIKIILKKKYRNIKRIKNV